MSKSDRSITFSMNVDNSKAAKKLNEVEQKIKKLEAEYNKLSTERDAATQSARQQEVVLDREMALLQEMRNAPKGTYEKAEIAEQTERVRGLRAEYNATERSVERMTEKMGRTSEKIDEAKTRAGELTEQITYSGSAAGRMAAATAEANKRMEKFANRVKNLAKRVFVFSLITSALRAMKDWFGNVIKSNKEASAAIAKLKGALLTLVQPLVNVIIPAFTTLVNVLTKVVNTLSNVLSPLFGTTAEEAVKAAEALYGESEAMNATGSAAKKAGGKLASFDEINTLSSNDEDTSSSIAPDFSGTVSNELSAVAELFMGMALLSLGVVLTFTGASIPTGLAMMAAGAIGLTEVVSINWGTIVKALQGPVGAITGLVGAALLVLGVVLLFSGAGIPLGLGLIVAGGVGLAASIIPNWNFLLEKIRGAWEAIKTWFNTHVSYYLSGDYWSLVGKSLINGFLETIENGLNFVLSGVGKLANGIIKVLNKIPGVEISNIDWGHLQLPRLASGAVIPPNREFLAVLGDQKSGTNIETPLATMVDAFKQALSEMGGTGGQMTVKLYLDGRELAENQVVHINNMTRENGEPVLLT